MVFYRFLIPWGGMVISYSHLCLDSSFADQSLFDCMLDSIFLFDKSILPSIGYKNPRPIDMYYGHESHAETLATFEKSLQSSLPY